MSVSLAEFKREEVNIKREVSPKMLKKRQEYKINISKTAYIQAQNEIFGIFRIYFMCGGRLCWTKILL